jgi:cell division protein FtsW
MYTRITEDKTVRNLIIILTILAGFGTAMLYSASSVIALEKFSDSAFFLKRHLVRLFISVGIMYIVIRIDYHIWKKSAHLLLILSILLLIATKISFLSGTYNGATRWLKLGSLSLQTAEFARFALIIFLAEYMERNRDIIDDFFHGFLPVFGLIAVTIFLIVIQPDFSTAVLLGIISFTLLFIGGAHVLHLGTSAAVASFVGTIVIFSHNYRFERLMSFLYPSDASRQASYQITQSLISLGNGGTTGLGLGDSLEKNLFLPEPHTDFIFSIIGEETGFIGCLLLLVLFLMFFLNLLKISKEAPDRFSAYLTLGTAFSIMLYALVNAAVAVGLFPVTGLPMPFFSYSGSQLLINFLLLGIVFNIARSGHRTQRFKTHRGFN